jgi:hypothetical protein
MSNPMTSNLTNLLTAILAADMFCILATIGTTTQSGLEALIGEYSVLGAVVLIILVIKTKTMLDGSTVDKINMLLTLTPFFLILIIIIYFIVLISKYFNKIVDKKISDYYYGFTQISTWLLLAQIGTLIYSMTKTTEFSKKIFSILMLLGTINAISLITLGIILKFYTTDG